MTGSRAVPDPDALEAWALHSACSSSCSAPFGERRLFVVLGVKAVGGTNVT